MYKLTTKFTITCDDTMLVLVLRRLATNIVLTQVIINCIVSFNSWICEVRDPYAI